MSKCTVQAPAAEVLGPRVYPMSQTEIYLSPYGDIHVEDNQGAIYTSVGVGRRRIIRQPGQPQQL